jgi:hypothetical protein
MPKDQPTSLAFHQDGTRFYLVHSSRDADDSEFDELIASLKAASAGRQAVSILVMTEGGAPNSMQRARLHRAVERDLLNVAVLSDSTFVRGVIMAFGWTGSIRVQGFAPGAIADALAHLGWSTVTPTAAEQALAQTRRRLTASR